jgi:hypothetical protein
LLPLNRGLVCLCDSTCSSWRAQVRDLVQCTRCADSEGHWSVHMRASHAFLRFCLHCALELLAPSCKNLCIPFWCSAGACVCSKLQQGALRIVRRAADCLKSQVPYIEATNFGGAQSSKGMTSDYSMQPVGVPPDPDCEIRTDNLLTDISSC